MHLISSLFTISAVTFCIFGADSTLDDEYPEVQISSGPIRGVKMASSWTNQTFYAFRGVPYAAPPRGDLRFKDPIPPQNWTTVRDCTSDGPSCFQPANMFETEILSVAGMSEDCLFLNVYSPELEPTGSLLPVIVWVHGGGFVSGSGNYSNGGPDWLLAEGVVVVTINYRLGAFGFFTLGTADAPGNSGMKDQRLAFLWIQNEIKNFGGDPNQVTLFGQSAGAACVHMHYLSPLSTGLFQRAITDSGNAIVGWAARQDQVWYGQQLAGLVNCTSTNVTVALECLRAVDAETLLITQMQVQPSTEDDTHGITLMFVPNVDTWSEQPFLPEMPEVLMENQQGAAVPFLMGTNKNDGAIDLFTMDNDAIQDSFNYLYMYIPEEERTSCSEETLDVLVNMINKFYFNDTVPSYTNIKGFLDLNTDAWFAYSTVVSARYYRQRADVYLYYFTFNGSFKESIVNQLDSLLNVSLVEHGEELNYIFVMSSINQTAQDNSNEMKTRKRMVRMWANFAKYGLPANGSDDLLEEVEWLPLGENSTRHLRIDVNLTMNHSDFLSDRMAFWDSLLLTASSSSRTLLASWMSVVYALLLLIMK